jgi:hypothetical protein
VKLRSVTAIAPGGGLARWTLFACEKQHPILAVETEIVSEWTVDGELVSVDLDDPYRMYPPQDRVLSTEIPSQLRQIHEEARAYIRAKEYTAAAVMSGRAIEGVCDLSDVQRRTLHDRLARMKENGLIDGRLWEWAETLRAVRNAAAHYSNESISRLDAEDAVAFTEALLDYLYVLTARFNALKERRAKRPGEKMPKRGLRRRHNVGRSA